MSDDRLIEFTALLDQFAAEQRARGLAETRLQRIIAQRSVGQACTIHCELTLPHGADAEEIYKALAPWDAAIDRFKAKSDLIDYYNQTLNKVGEIEVAMAKMAHDQSVFAGQNEERNANRRVAVGYTSQQVTTLENSRTTIKAGFERIEELKESIDECQRTIGGEEWARVLEDRISARLERLRGAMRESAEAA